MGCGWHCITHNSCLVYGCDGTHRGPCPSNRPITLYATKDGMINASDIETLRVNLTNEITRWKQHINYKYKFNYPTRSYRSGDGITTTSFNDIILALNGVRHGSTSFVSNVNLITAVKLVNDMKKIYDSFRTDCICNSYKTVYESCSCHGNVCTKCYGY